MNLVALPVIAILGGFLYSLRGGGISRLVGRDVGTQAARLTWCLPTGVFFSWVAGLPLYWFAILPTLLFLGLMLPHGLFQNRKPVGLNFTGMSIFGLLRGLLLVDPMIFLSGTSPLNLSISLLGFSLMGLAYWIGWRSPSPLPNWWQEKSTAMGEVYTGAFIWSFIFVGFSI